MELHPDSLSALVAGDVAIDLPPFHGGLTRTLRRAALRFAPGHAGRVLAIFAAVWFSLGFIGSAVDDAATHVLMITGAPHAISWSSVMRHTAWFGAANLVLGLGILAVSGRIVTRLRLRRRLSFAPPNGIVGS